MAKTSGPHQHRELTRRLECYLSILSDLSRIASETSDLNGLLHLACVQLARATGVRHSKVLRYRPERGDLLMVAGVGWGQGLVGSAAFGSDFASVPGRTVQTRLPLVVEDVAGATEYRPSHILRQHGIVSLAGAPIIVDNRVWGVLEVDSDQPRGFDGDDIAFLASCANCLGVAIQRDAALVKAEEELVAARAAFDGQRTLLREAQHRFKNNLQVIASTLILEQQRAAGEEARQALEHVMARVMAISLAQDQLVLRQGSSVALAGYLAALAGAFGHQHDWLLVETDLAELDLPVDRATPLGLVVNEMMTNAVKHAFPDRHGTVYLTLRNEPGGVEGVLVVEDDGRGLGEQRPGGWGMRLIDALVRQIGGTVEHQPSERGTRFEVRFPLVG